MANVLNMSGGGKDPVIQSKRVKSTTTQQTVTAPSGVDGYNPITVEAIKLQEKYTKSSDQLRDNVEVRPDSGYDGLSLVTVRPVPLQEKTVSLTEPNENFFPDSYAGYLGFSKITVNARLQEKGATPSTEAQVIVPDEGYCGLKNVLVGAVKLQSKTVTPSDSQQIITADSPNIGLSQVTVEAASGAKIGVWLNETPTTTSRIRLSNTKGITTPHFVVIQYSTVTPPIANYLQTAIWCDLTGFATRCIYMNSNSQIFLESEGINVSMDGGTILIEITSSNFIFDPNYTYSIFISESV
nr:MAG TPA: hypothetical protein [Caudoviricetes sp.]